MRRNNSPSEPDLLTKRRLGERELCCSPQKERPPRILPGHWDSILPMSRSGSGSSTKRAFRALRFVNVALAKALARHLRATRLTAFWSLPAPLQPKSDIALKGGPRRNLQMLR